MKVNEIFYSIQGEGYHTGSAAVFVRFSGCNLKCPFCDTDFRQFQEMTEEEIVSKVNALSTQAKLVVLTGGEPSLQLTASLVEKLHSIGKYVAIETNGTRTLPENIDWVTLSPKEPFVGASGRVVLQKCSEVKIVDDGDIKTLSDMLNIVDKIDAEHYFIQPCDTGDADKNREIIEYCVDFVKSNPKWRISLQTQKILKVR